LNTIADNGDEYRCILSNPYADTLTTDTIRLLVSGADFEVTPAVSGVTFWRLAVDGPLILDPANSTQYTLKSLDINRTRMITKMWGEGTCGSKGGYTEGIIPIQQNNRYTVRLNAGAGSGGDPGGGYAGIFSGTTVSQANALLIAGGAGGGGRNSTTACAYLGGSGGGDIGGDGADASSSTSGGDGGTQSAGGVGGNSTGTFTTSVSFTTAGTHSVTIPSDATNVTFEIVGGTGGKGGDTSSGQTAKSGGRGQRVTGSLTNVAGQTLTLYVGSNGSDGSSGTSVFGGSGGSGYRSGGSGGKSGPEITSVNVVQNFSSSSSVTIPSNIQSILLDVVGGKGGSGGNSTLLPAGEGGGFSSKSGAPGGWGQRVFAYPNLSSVAGKTLSFVIGQNGQTATGNVGTDTGGAGGSGYNSGGKGGDQFGDETWGTGGAGGGGGGSTAVLDGSTPIVIAGGGGGGGGAAAAASSFPTAGTTSSFISDFANYSIINSDSFKLIICLN
jgi:hypothetical protein